MKRAIIVMIAFAFAAAAVRFASATTFATQELRCPVCGHEFKARILASTNSFGGHDRDFLAYSTGQNPVLTVPLTCVGCYYSGYPNDFDTLETSIVSKLKKEIIDKKALKPMRSALYDPAADTAAVGLPAFVKYDLIAQCYAMRGRETSEIFTQYISASWAVRLENELYFDLRSAEAQKTFEWLHKSVDMTAVDTGENNNAASELAAGRMLLKKAAALEGDDRLYCSFGALFFLRRHGENAEAEKALEIVKTALDEARYAPLEKKVRDSIAIERKFQRMAADALEADLASGVIKGAAHQAQMYYLAGELNRRCLDMQKARKFYEKTISIKEAPDQVARYAREQLELCK